MRDNQCFKTTSFSRKENSDRLRRTRHRRRRRRPRFKKGFFSDEREIFFVIYLRGIASRKRLFKLLYFLLITRFLLVVAEIFKNSFVRRRQDLMKID